MIAPRGDGSPRSPAAIAPASFRGRLFVVGVAAAFYVVALATPALVFLRAPAVETQTGLSCLLLGGLVVFAGQPAWLANPVLLVVVALVLARRYVAAALVAGVALALQLSTLLIYDAPLPGDEAGSTQLVLKHLGVGFFAWIASTLALALGALVLRARDPR